MNKKQTTIITVLSLVIILLILLISVRLWFRVDMSKNKSWTISRVSKNLALEIPDQVRITYFVSDKLKKLYSFPSEIEDLINEYVSYSGGKINFVERDPSKDNLDQKMQELGFPAQQVRATEKDQASFINVYSGILIEYENRSEALPFVFRMDTLEYDLTSRIRALVREKEKTIGLIIGDALKTVDREYRYMERYLSLAGYKIRSIPIDGMIPENLTGLFVIGGTETLDDWMLYQIDRFIQTGGKIYFALNSVDININYEFSAKEAQDKGILAMLASYGVSVEQTLVLDQSALPIPQPSSMSGGLQIISLAPYPFYVHILSQNSNPDHPITSRFAGADLYWANPLELNAPENVEAVPLFTTSERAWLETKDFAVDPQQSFLFANEAEQTRGVKILAAALSGKFPSYWKDKPAPVREGSDEDLPAMPEAASEARIVVVGNAGSAFDFSMGNIDFINNNFAGEQPNLEFLAQTADWLGNDDDIISIRNRAPLTGRLDKIIDPEERFAAYALARIFCTVIMPLAVLIFGIGFAYRRKKQSRANKESVYDL
ncbi:MAG: GldG family protein [Spirochaetaceae bacterium]|nr:GldG family protein [Spirochaetaceae bacterium]